MEKTEGNYTGTLIDIPRFNLNESVEIGRLFHEHKIYYEKNTGQIYSGPAGGYHEYIFSVPEEQFYDAIELLKEYFGIGAKYAERFTGTCPSCGAEVLNIITCPDCELNLAGDYTEALKEHPFLIFLKQEDLIGLENEESLDQSPTKSPSQKIFTFLTVLISTWVVVILLFIAIIEGQLNTPKMIVLAMILLTTFLLVKKMFSVR